MTNLSNKKILIMPEKIDVPLAIPPLIIMVCGLPGTGKTSSTEYLEQKLEGYDRYGTNETRRALGFKRYSWRQTPVVFGRMYNSTYYSLSYGRGVILEANYKHPLSRQNVYNIADSFRREVIIIQFVCSEKESKRRMRHRKKNDGLVTSPRDTRVYDRVKSQWHDTTQDLKHNPHVSLIRYNTETDISERVRVNSNVSPLVEVVERLLTEHSSSYKQSIKPS